MKILIIGNSAAGTAAIESIRRYDQESSIVQVSDERHQLYSRCLLSYYLSDSIPREGLQYRDPGFHTQMRVELHEGTRAVHLDADRQCVTCDDGSVHEFDKLLIATGSSAKFPANIPQGIEGVNVFRTLDDVEVIRTNVKRARRAVVLGGGLIGMKAAVALSECGLVTSVVVRSSRVLSQMIDQEASRFVTERLSTSSIEVFFNTDITEVESRGNTLEAVRTDSGQSIPCELLVVAKGVQPNTDLIVDTDIRKRWGIETNAHMQTSRDNIYAAGDVAETFDITTGQHAVSALWTCAVQQGHLAGLNMIGRGKAYDGAVLMNSLSIGGIPLISYGVTNPPEGEGYQVITREQGGAGVYKKIVLREHRIRGIILLGRIDNAGVLLSLIQRREDVSSFEDRLVSDQFGYGALVGSGSASDLARYHNP